VKTVRLLRHAKSDWDEPGLPDEERPLNGRGKRDAKALARHLSAHPIRLDAVFCSTAVRARKTLEAIAPSLGGATTSLEKWLYGAGPEELLAFLRGLPDDLDSVLLIGHNPGLQELAYDLLPAGKAPGSFPTCTLATITLTATSWSTLRPARGNLAALQFPPNFT